MHYVQYGCKKYKLKPAVFEDVSFMHVLVFLTSRYLPYSGVDGQNGSKGDIGPMGPAGVKGDMGLPGVKGEPGVKGDMGAEGLQGLQGQIVTNVRLAPWP